MNKYIALISGILGAIIGFALTIYLNPHNLSDLEYCNYHTLEYKMELIEYYNDYYYEVESVLDALDESYDWTDSHDFKKYYEARERLDSVFALEQ